MTRKNKNKISADFNNVIETELALARRGEYAFGVLKIEVGKKIKFYEVENFIQKRIRSYDFYGRLSERKSCVVLRKIENSEVVSVAESIKKFMPEAFIDCYVYPQNNVKIKSVEELDVLPFFGMPYEKRILDVLLSLIIILLFFPAAIMISVIIKMASPGPVLFKQERIGKSQKKFIMYKFRTMNWKNDNANHIKYLKNIIRDAKLKNGEIKTMKKMDDLDRIYPFGRFLRKYCIDEIPQILNVLKGDMSIVGPRPPVSYEVEEYEDWYKERFDVHPGLTGLWQVSGKNQVDFEKMVRLDIRYKKKYQLIQDLKIILRTPIVILKQYI